MPGADVLRVLPEALKLGFHHVDTAQIYGNEAEVGEAIHASGVARADIFLTTKVWVDKYAHRDFLASVDESLKKLKTDHVDLLLLHWPGGSDVPMAERIGALNEVHKAGKVRHIGVSNFNVAQMEEAVKLSDAPIATNQVEYHPYLSQRALLAAMRERDLVLIAHSPLARGTLLNDPLLQEIAQRRRLSAAQVALRWIVQQERCVAIPGAQNVEQLRENLKVLDCTLTNDEMAAISALARGTRIVDPKHGPAWDPA